MARCVARRNFDRGAVWSGEIADRPLHRQARSRIDLRRGGFDRGRAHLGLLLCPACSDGCRIHQRLCPGTRWSGPKFFGLSDKSASQVQREEGVDQAGPLRHLHPCVDRPRGLTRTLTRSTPNMMPHRPISAAKPMPAGPWSGPATRSLPNRLIGFWRSD